VLSGDHIKEIHLASLRILKEAGMILPHQDVLAMLSDVGADVDFDANRVLFPPDLVENSLKKAPASFTLYGRDTRQKIVMEQGEVHFSSLLAALYVIGIDGDSRRGTLEDAENFTRLSDGLEYIDVAGCGVDPGDVADSVMYAYADFAMLTNTTKPFIPRGLGRQSHEDAIRMAEIVVGGSKELKEKPIILCGTNSISPLGITTEELDTILLYAAHGLPLYVSPQAQAGATAPITLAGLLAQQNAENLAGITLAQLANPGNPVMYATTSSIFDMKSGITPYCSPESALINIASAQLARFYNLPSRGTGAASDSHIVDVQAGLEAGMKNLSLALSGITFINQGTGGLSNSMAASYEKMVIDNEIFGMVRTIIEGIDVNEETLAIDLIKDVGPLGEFLTTNHTLERCRTEHFSPQVVVRKSYDVWNKKGRDEMLGLAREKARRILAEHEPEPLEPAVEQELKEYIRAIEERELKS